MDRPQALKIFIVGLLPDPVVHGDQAAVNVREVSTKAPKFESIADDLNWPAQAIDERVWHGFRPVSLTGKTQPPPMAIKRRPGSA